jgi:site-specific recombinase
MTIWYAILTGVVLWMASITGGWFDNWCVYHRIPEGIARHPAGARFGRAPFEAIGRALARHASGWGTNISLGFMLGMMPAVGRFTGLPIDVRHVTLNSGIMALAASGLEAGPRPIAFLLWAGAGIGVMFVFNLSVSFACSLFNATKAYELPGDQVRGILRGIGRRLRRSPLQFVRPPKADAEGTI